jgi:hypothetical protein
MIAYDRNIKLMQNESKQFTYTGSNYHAAQIHAICKSAFPYFKQQVLALEPVCSVCVHLNLKTEA